MTSTPTARAPRVGLGWPWVGSLVALAAAAVVVSAGWGGERTATAITDLAGVLSTLGGAVVVLRVSTRPGRPTAAWRWIAAAMFLWGLGEVIWGWYEVVLGDEVPFPSVADAAYLAAVPLAVLGLLGFTRETRARVRLGTLLDGCLVAASLLFVTWAVVLGPVWRSDAGSLLANTISVAYPVTDLVMAVLALMLVSWRGTLDRAALRTVAAALLVMAVTDSAFTWLTNAGTYSSTNPISLLWPLSYLMVAFASTLRDREVSVDLTGEEPVASLVIPYATLLAAIAVAIPRVAGGDPLGPFLTANGAALIALVLARQALTARDLRLSVRALHDRELALERMAHEDPLTGLANRARFVDRLEVVAERRHDIDPAVVYVDLDGFKQVNDHFGHAVGDELLVEVSARLQACLGPDMLLARLGGDEFVVLVEAGHDVAVALAREVLRAFELPFQAQGEAVPFCASLGIASAPAGGSPDEAVRRADAAMYVAKASGKGRAVAYPDEHLVDVPSDA